MKNKLKIVNLLWGFNTGGIRNCFLAYADVGKYDSSLEIKTVIINFKNRNYDLSPLHEVGGQSIDICNRLDLSWIWRLRRILKTEAPDIIFTHGFNGPVVVLVERILGIRCRLLCSYHGEYDANRPIKKLLIPVYNHIMHSIYKSYAEKVLSVSEFSMNYLKKRCNISENKLICIHNGIDSVWNGPHHDFSEISPVFADNSVIKVALASRLTPIKGIEYYIDAIAQLKKEHPEYKIATAIFGQGESYEALKAKTENLGLEQDVFFAGNKNDLPGWLPQADIFVLPSVSENHSVVLLEAMRADCAIIATNVGGNGESVRDMQEGLLIPSRNPQAIKESLLKLIRNETLRQKLANNARERFQANFTRESQMQKLAAWIKGE